MRVEGSTIREIGRSLGRSSDLGFVRIENQGICEDEKLYIASRKEMVVEGVSQQLQFNHYCGLFIISLNYACRDFNSGCYCVLLLNLGQN